MRWVRCFLLLFFVGEVGSFAKHLGARLRYTATAVTLTYKSVCRLFQYVQPQAYLPAVFAFCLGLVSNANAVQQCFRVGGPRFVAR